MSQTDTADNLKRRLPSVDAVLQEMPELIELRGHVEVSKVIRSELGRLRQEIDAGVQPPVSVEVIRAKLTRQLTERNQPSLKSVMNMTGTVLHTNLGRAVLPQEAIDAVINVAGSPSNLEFDLESAARGERDSHVEALICELTGAEAATFVNNNAAAVLLVLNTLAKNKEVPVSRGELVEIGGSFRIPEVMQGSGCQLVEIGATNRTHLKDYGKAIGENTGLLLKVHTSNYRIQGFTHAVSELELAELAHQHQLPLVVDLGSGSLIDFAKLGLPGEPTAAQSLANGVDIITFSGDKLLGGPQCGIIAGRKVLVDQMRQNPLKRALRLDKMTLAALAEVLKLYRDPTSLLKKLPTLRYLTRALPEMQQQARRVVPLLQAALPNTYQVGSKLSHSQIGSGALPVETLESIVIYIAPVQACDSALRDLSTALRALPCPVIGRTQNGEVLLDLRCMDDADAFLEQLPLLTAAFK
jgi:L-seryl-tRNA(Ser) seleniumtransferase